MLAVHCTLHLCVIGVENTGNIIRSAKRKISQPKPQHDWYQVGCRAIHQKTQLFQSKHRLRWCVLLFLIPTLYRSHLFKLLFLLLLALPLWVCIWCLVLICQLYYFHSTAIIWCDFIHTAPHRTKNSFLTLEANDFGLKCVYCNTHSALVYVPIVRWQSTNNKRQRHIEIHHVFHYVFRVPNIGEWVK